MIKRVTGNGKGGWDGEEYFLGATISSIFSIPITLDYSTDPAPLCAAD